MHKLNVGKMEEQPSQQCSSEICDQISKETGTPIPKQECSSGQHCACACVRVAVRSAAGAALLRGGLIVLDVVKWTGGLCVGEGG